MWNACIWTSLCCKCDDRFSFSPVFAPSELQAVLEGFHCEEYHGLMDGRLLICTVAVGCALFALAWDYFHPFPLSRPILIVCVLSYPFCSINWNMHSACMLSYNFLCLMWYKCQSERKDDVNVACVMFRCGDTFSKSVFCWWKLLILCTIDIWLWMWWIFLDEHLRISYWWACWRSTQHTQSEAFSCMRLKRTRLVLTETMCSSCRPHWKGEFLLSTPLC